LASIACQFITGTGEHGGGDIVGPSGEGSAVGVICITGVIGCHADSIYVGFAIPAGHL
jgi:hypothetical protein